METIKLWDNVPGMCKEEPVLEFYPAENKTSDIAVVICPGGAYCCRAGHEGKNYAEFFNEHGINAFVCEYRVAPHKFPLPLLDARRSIRYVRHNAEKYGINPNKICIMGSSAGGHLSAMTSTYTEPIEFEGLDEIDNENFMPNGTILCYPVISMYDDTVGHIYSKVCLLGEEKAEMAPLLSPDLSVKDTTPPAFIWHTAEDQGVTVINSYNYAAALRKHHVPCEMHVFPFGCHGLGLSPDDPHLAQWTGLLLNWLDIMFNK